MPRHSPMELLRNFFKLDSAGGILLVIMAVLAMIFANSPLFSLYNGFLNLPVHVQFGDLKIAKPLVLWINDGLMAMFFFLTGLEVKREMIEGELSTPSQVMLPGVAAVVGIAVPATIYYFFNNGDPIASRGWAIPSATDIAFAVGIFSLFKTRVPLSLKLFLLSVAIFDDIGAIIIIALFYSSDLSTVSLIVASLGLTVLLLLNLRNIRHRSVYIIVSVVVWVAVLKSGVHATLAGFACALFIPLRLKDTNDHPMLVELEHGLKPWVNFLILPLFAFANAGVNLAGVTLDSVTKPIPLGIALGLFLGKQFGIFSISYITIKLRLARLPQGANWWQFYAVCVLCGIGFTMSLFIGALAFENQPEPYGTEVKLGVLIGSLASALVAAGMLMVSPRVSKIEQQRPQTALTEAP